MTGLVFKGGRAMLRCSFLAPGKKLPKPRKVHHGINFPLCGTKSTGPMLADRWSVVDCGACLRVQRARHDKPSR